MDMDWLTSDRMLHLIFAHSNVDYYFQMCVQGHICWLLYSNVHPGSYFWWLQLQRRGEQAGVCIAAVSHWVAHCLKCLSFCLIRLQLHLVEVFLEPCLAVVECWGRWSRNGVGSPEDFIVSYKSKWNEWQPTCTLVSRWIRLCIAALRIAAGDSNSPAICSKSVRCCLIVCRDISWWMTADISFVIDIKWSFFDGKHVWWCLSQDIAWILHELHTNHQVLMYG